MFNLTFVVLVTILDMMLPYWSQKIEWLLPPQMNNLLLRRMCGTQVNLSEHFILCIFLITLMFNLSYLPLRRHHLFIIFGFFNPKSDHENCQSWAQLSLQFITSRVHSHFWKNISAVDNAQLKHLTIGLHISTQLKRLSQAGKR